MPATICSSVLLPEPFSPTTQKVSPRSTVNDDISESPEVLVERQSIERCKFLESVFGIAVDRDSFSRRPENR